MSENWSTVDIFPQYEVSDLGRVRNKQSEFCLSPNPNQYGALKLNLMRDNEKFTVGLNHIVARAHIESPMREDFDTIIHLDGDRMNCKASNLMWRPRYFAVRYHEQFSYESFERAVTPVQDRKTGRVYARIQDAVMEHGLIYQEILVSVHMNTYVWPTFQYFCRPTADGV